MECALGKSKDGTCHFLAAPLEGHENSLDVKHVALCFAAEVVAVNPQAGATFAGILCTMMQKFESPLLVADTWINLGECFAHLFLPRNLGLKEPACHIMLPPPKKRHHVTQTAGSLPG